MDISDLRSISQKAFEKKLEEALLEEANKGSFKALLRIDDFDADKLREAGLKVEAGCTGNYWRVSW
jgi:hypothetical protein